MTIKTLLMLKDQSLALSLYNACFPIAVIEDRNMDSFSIILSCDSDQPIRVVKSGANFEKTYLLESSDPEKVKAVSALMEFAEMIGKALGVEDRLMRSSVLEIIVDNDGLFTLQTRSIVIQDEQSISAIHQITEYMRNNLLVREPVESAEDFSLSLAQNEHEGAANE